MRRRGSLSQYFIGLSKPQKKRHAAIDDNVRNHQASIKNIETQLGKLTTPVNERLPPRNQDQKSQHHVTEIYTEEEVHSEPFMIHETTTKKPDSYMEEEKPETKKMKIWIAF